MVLFYYRQPIIMVSAVLVLQYRGRMWHLLASEGLVREKMGGKIYDLDLLS
jgi:hypothetical protein